MYFLNRSLLLLTMTVIPLFSQAQDTEPAILPALSEEAIGVEADLSDPEERHDMMLIDLNAEDISALVNIPGFGYGDVEHLREHILRYGPLRSYHEMQAVEGFDPARIRKLLPRLTEKLRYGRETGSAPTRTTVRSHAGTDVRKTSAGRDTGDIYPGKPVTYGLFCVFPSGRNTVWSFRTEKDMGEKARYLFVSGYYLYRSAEKLKTLVAGDFQASSAQGLLLGSGMAATRSAAVMNIMRNNKPLRPWNSFSETGFIRGAGFSCALPRNINLSMYAGRRIRDAALKPSGDREVFGSILRSGNYRTESELRSRHKVKQTVAGMLVGFKGRHAQLGIGYAGRVNDRKLSQDAEAIHRLYGAERAVSHRAGIDWKWQHGNLLFFGEAVFGWNQRNAFLAGLLLASGKKSDLSVLLRSYDPGFDASMSNAFGDLSSNQNERGIYTGLHVNLNRRWHMSAYNDLVVYPWLRYRINIPGSAHEQMLDLEKKEKNGHRLNIRWRRRTGMAATVVNPHLNGQESQRTDHFRIHAEYLAGPCQMKTRLEMTRCRQAYREPENGSLIYHEFSVPIGPAVDVDLRIYVHSAASYRSRTFAYESDLPGRFAIRSYDGNGNGAYIMIRARPSKDLLIWLRFAHSMAVPSHNRNQGIIENSVQIQIEWKPSRN